MNNLVTRKKLGAATGLASLAIGGVVAYAYFTTTGSGTATGTVGTSSNLSISGALSGGAADGNFYPGGPARTVTFTVVNNSPGTQALHVIHLSDVRAYPTAGDRTGDTNQITGCGAADFSMADVTVDRDLAPGSHSLAETGTIGMVDTGVNQDACKSAFLTFVFSASDPGPSYTPSLTVSTPNP